MEMNQQNDNAIHPSALETSRVLQQRIQAWWLQYQKPWRKVVRNWGAIHGQVTKKMMHALAAKNMAVYALQPGPKAQ
jgi:hypothetical protein